MAKRAPLVDQSWLDAVPARAAAPFSGAPQPPAKTPLIAWQNDQTPPPPSAFVFQPGYSDHTYQAFSAPLGFEGFDLDRIRRAVAQHRQGYFYESSLLAFALLGFAPVLAALQQAIAPILALKRHVHGGDKGLAKLVAAEIEEQLVPSSGLLPSIYLPPTAWGTMAIYIRMMGFCVLQHVDGDPDPDTGVRPRYTRIFEPWAVNYYRSPRKWMALTTEGPIEIKNDGKFTIVADEQEPHLTGAVVALGEEALGGKLTQQARNSWIDHYGNPKWVATLPEKVATQGATGDAFFAALSTIIGPDGYGSLPYGSKFETVGLKGEASSAFSEALISAIAHIAMVLVGSDGTIMAGEKGVYTPKEGAQWTVRQDLISRPVTAIVRSLNGGHAAPYCDINYADGIERSKRVGAWVYPTLEVPLPDPDRDSRIESFMKRRAALTTQVTADRDAGIVVTQDDINKLATAYEVDAPTLAEASTTPVDRLNLDSGDVAKVTRVDEARASRGLPPIGDERGALTVAELEALAKAKAAQGPTQEEAAAEAAPERLEPSPPDAASSAAARAA